ncbi:SDR family NAD(P)-dependent oxidoreductase [Salinisphaera sp.]|uniref:SDR family NAD(P)-dependent oxidoreductase n=1 Tax=Salinisphaera sp. TaxID=1914330 RepID=UPI002D792FDE|nr:SDR family NAD(P)-dependent oxidoreductase [Salinisphaera sp.]HET7313650.1 SDR family NAD(P)-dependent oxidoreductase [Salinisphaera sp.]
MIGIGSIENQDAVDDARRGRQGRVLITGGAGFVGSNLAAHFAAQGRQVVVFDNLSRPGVTRNLEWLRDRFGRGLLFVRGDVRDADAVARAVASCDQVFHLAAQVAVTTGLADPRADFDINLGGTLNVLEAVRAQAQPPGVVFTSTNKVYGNLAGLSVQALERRYRPLDDDVAETGVDEWQALDFCSPYGCSKGGADQYVLDYARSFGVPAVVFRMSCIYGPRQFGTEDQGWVAHFLLSARAGEPLTIYGDGKQVRDVLFVDDLVAAFAAAERHIEALAGRAFNIGGGSDNTLSLLELLSIIDEFGDRAEINYADWRTGDQPYYVSNTRAFGRATGWRPAVAPRQGIERLYAWLDDVGAPASAESGARAAP